MTRQDRAELRRKVADAELAAEHAEQLMLAAHHPQPGNRDLPPHARLRAAVGNLAVYALCLGVSPDERDRQSVATLVAAATELKRVETLEGERLRRVLAGEKLEEGRA